MTDYKKVMKWYSDNRKVVINTFMLNNALGIDSHFDIDDSIYIVITPEGYPNVKDKKESERQSWRFKFLQNRLKKLLSNTVQS